LRFCCSYIWAASWLVAPYLLLCFTCLLRTDIGGAPLPEIWFKGLCILLLTGSLFNATGDIYCCSYGEKLTLCFWTRLAGLIWLAESIVLKILEDGTPDIVGYSGVTRFSLDFCG